MKFWCSYTMFFSQLYEYAVQTIVNFQNCLCMFVDWKSPFVSDHLMYLFNNSYTYVLAHDLGWFLSSAFIIPLFIFPILFYYHSLDLTISSFCNEFQLCYIHLLAENKLHLVSYTCKNIDRNRHFNTSVSSLWQYHCSYLWCNCSIMV